MPDIKNVEAGDTVEMLYNLGKDILSMPIPRLGIVQAVNGYYVYVKPIGKTFVQDFYKNEIKEHRAVKI